MGRSPEFATASVTRVRPALSSIVPPAGKISPGIMARSPYGLMDRHQFGAVRKRRFDLHIGDHLGYAFHSLPARDQLSAAVHQVRDGLSITRAFENKVRDQ